MPRVGELKRLLEYRRVHGGGRNLAAELEKHGAVVKANGDVVR